MKENNNWYHCSIYRSKNTTKIWICEIDIGNLKTLKTTLFFSSGTKLFITFLSLRFFDMRRERERRTISFYADFSISPHYVRHPAVNYWSGLAELWKSTCFVQAQISTNFFFFFQIPKFSAHRFRAWRHSHPRIPFPIWGFYCDICDCHTRPACAWTPVLNVCTELTHALSWKVLSLTKLKGKIYKTKNDNIKKIPP